MKPKVPWVRLTAEGAVVVASILMAFAIDASWDRRQARSAEQEVLARLEAGLEEGVRLAQAEQELTQRDVHLLEVFLAMTPDEAARIDADSTWFYVQALFRPGARDLNSTALAATLDESRLLLASDAPLQNAVAAWQSAAVRYDQRLNVLLALEQEVLRALALHPEIRSGLAPAGRQFGPGASRIAREDDQVMGGAARKHLATRIKVLMLNQFQEASAEALELVRQRMDRR